MKPHCLYFVEMHKSGTMQMTDYSHSSKILRLSGNTVNQHIIFKLSTLDNCKVIQYNYSGTLVYPWLI